MSIENTTTHNPSQILRIDLSWSAWSRDRACWESQEPGALTKIESAWTAGRNLIIESLPKKEIRYGRVVLHGPSRAAAWVFEEGWDEVGSLAEDIPGFGQAGPNQQEEARRRLHETILSRPEGELRLGLHHRLDQGGADMRAMFRDLLAGRGPQGPRADYGREVLRRLQADPGALAGFLRSLESDGTSPCAARIEGGCDACSFDELLARIDEAEEDLLGRLKEASIDLDDMLGSIGWDLFRA